MTETITERSQEEIDKEFDMIVKEIDVLGVGNPDAKISYKKQLESGELLPEVVEQAVEYIKRGEGMRTITDHDDGCIDGRCAHRVLFVTESGEFYETPVDDSGEHLRAKVAGGGYMTSLAMRAGLGETTASIDNDLGGVVAQLAEKDIYCGAHTGQHAGNETTDCGANDKFADILANGLEYRDVIARNVRALVAEAGLETDEAILDKVFAGWQRALDVQYGADSTGASRFTVIEEGIKEAQVKTGSPKPVAVSKDLKGDHKEDFILINYRDNETFSQAAFAEMLAEKFPDVPEDKRAQAFVVDVPRIVMLAEAQSDGDTDRFTQALYAGITYQLATAATLTDGSLRTFVIK